RLANGARDLLYGFRVAAVLDQNSVSDQVAHVHPGQPQHQRKAVLDLAVVGAIEVPDLLDRLLNGGDHEQPAILPQLAEELEEPDVFGELPSVRFRTQEFRQLVDDEQEPARMAGQAPRPAVTPIAI